MNLCIAMSVPSLRQDFRVLDLLLNINLSNDAHFLFRLLVCDTCASPFDLAVNHVD